MERSASKRSSIAWFKLAEFVSRGERERALSIYRLLSHSIHNRAFVAQLRGDILRAFNDAQALQAYEEAAEYYASEDKTLQAAVLYEQMSELDSNSYERAMKVLQAYQKSGWSEKVIECARRVIDILLRQKRYSQVHEVLRELPLPAAKKAELHERFAIGLLGSQDMVDRTLLEAHIVAALKGYNNSDQEKERVSRFFGKLATLDEQAYQFASQRYPLSS